MERATKTNTVTSTVPTFGKEFKRLMLAAGLVLIVFSACAPQDEDPLLKATNNCVPIEVTADMLEANRSSRRATYAAVIATLTVEAGYDSQEEGAMVPGAPTLEVQTPIPYPTNKPNDIPYFSVDPETAGSALAASDLPLRPCDELRDDAISDIFDNESPVNVIKTYADMGLPSLVKSYLLIIPDKLMSPKEKRELLAKALENQIRNIKTMADREPNQWAEELQRVPMLEAEAKRLREFNKSLENNPTP